MNRTRTVKQLPVLPSTPSVRHSGRFGLALCALASALLWSSPARAEIYLEWDFESPPTSELDGGYYDVGGGDRLTLHLTGAEEPGKSRMEHVTTGGWQSSGAAKMYPIDTRNSSGEGYCELWPQYGAQNPAQLNVRLLIQWSPGYAAAGQGGEKLMIIGTQSGIDTMRSWIQLNSPEDSLGGYQLQLAYHNTVYFVHGNGADCVNSPCSYYECCHCEANCALGNPTTPFQIGDYEGQWVALEWEARSDGERSIYLWTQDGSFDGLYMRSTDTAIAEGVGGVAGIGAYLGAHLEGSFFIVDEVVIADEPIGPPPEFGQAAPECSDGVDNDGDGAADHPDDPGCTSPDDADESDCGDGVCEGDETVDSCTSDCGGGSGGSGTGGSATGGNATGGAAVGAGGAGESSAAPVEEGDGGCGCVMLGDTRARSFSAWWLIGLLAVRRRRRPS